MRKPKQPRYKLKSSRKMLKFYYIIIQLRLRRAVRPVQEDELVDLRRANEVAEQPVDRVLHFFLAGDANVGLFGRRVEHLEAANGAGRVRHLLVPEVIDRVDQVHRRVAQLLRRGAQEELRVFLEREDRAVLDEVTRDGGTDVLDLAAGVHRRSVLARP